MTSKKSNLVDVGQITAVYGVKGWVKIHSNTEPLDNILHYQPWWLKTRHGVKAVEIVEGRRHGKGLVAHIRGVDDRDHAAEFCKVGIAIERDQLPELAADEYYWSDLEGLTVISEFEGGEFNLGTVKRILETGANDVLVVQGEADSLDQRERLVPYVPGQFVTAVDLAKAELRVDWDPEF